MAVPRNLGLLAASCGLALAAGPVSAAVELSAVGTATERAHLVAAGTPTTYVIGARNNGPAPVTAALRIQAASGAPGDWRVVLSPADPLFRALGTGSEELALTLAPGQTAHVVATVTPGPALAEGSEGEAVVSAWTGGTLDGRVELRSQVRNRPKTYYIALDGCGPAYLGLNRQGRPFTGAGERLMPRAWSFASRSAHMTRASAVLPSVTDPNHAAALTGSWAGTSGIYSVRTHYLGTDEHGDPVQQGGTRGLLRWGARGDRVESVFDVARRPAAGGTRAAFNVIVSGKNWVAELLRDGALDLIVHGKSYPDYVPKPQVYRLGDPPSDPDAAQDREGTNLGPRPIKHLFSPERQLTEGFPDAFPDDRWVAEAAVRVIQAEDPDVLYVNLADADAVQHLFGSADRPSEWDDRGTAVLWDDDNVYNAYANRDPVLDVLYEADLDFGLITDLLESRQTLARSYVVLYSDHGLNTVANTPENVIDPGRILLDGGVVQQEVEWIGTWGESGFIAVRDPAASAHIEAVLEAYERLDPATGATVKPFLVFNRAEMETGVDSATGGLTPAAGAHRGSLYSEWNIDQPNPNNTKVRWPDVMFFTHRPFHTVTTRVNLEGSNWPGYPFQGDHGSAHSADVVLAIGGPGIRPGAYDAAASLTDIAPTLYRLIGAAAPANVDGRVLEEILR